MKGKSYFVSLSFTLKLYKKIKIKKKKTLKRHVAVATFQFKQKKQNKTFHKEVKGQKNQETKNKRSWSVYEAFGKRENVR